MTGFFHDPLMWIFVAALALLLGPPLAIAAVRHMRHRVRRRLVDSPRKIAVTASAPVECRHERSRSRARVEPDGSYRSVCKRCGVAMMRLGPGDWEPISDDPSAPSASANSGGDGAAGED